MASPLKIAARAAKLVVDDLRRRRIPTDELLKDVGLRRADLIDPETRIASARIHEHHREFVPALTAQHFYFFRSETPPHPTPPPRGGPPAGGLPGVDLGDVRLSRLKLRSTQNVSACVYVRVASLIREPGRGLRPPFDRCREETSTVTASCWLRQGLRSRQAVMLGSIGYWCGRLTHFPLEER